MEYLGEHLLPGKIGQFFAVVSFVASLVATIAFYTASKKQSITSEYKSWLQLARWAFFAETVSVFIIFGTLYYIISHHVF